MGLRINLAAILDLAEHLKPHTIDAVLARSELKLGLDALLEKRRRGAARSRRPEGADAKSRAAPPNCSAPRRRGFTQGRC